MLIRSSIHSLKMETGYDSKHVVDLDLQFPEGPKYTAARKAALVRELRTRLAALPGVAAITSARPPDDSGFRTAAVSLEWRKTLAAKYAVDPPLHLRPAKLLPDAWHSAVSGPRLSTAGRPAGALRHSQRIGRETALAGPEPHRPQPPSGAPTSSSTIKGELLADGPAYQVIGVARDTRGVELDGSDSKQVYLPLPEDRLQDHPILIRTQSDPAQIMRAIDPVISSIDPDLVATSSTLEEMLRQSPPFIISSLAAAVASTVGLLGLLLASMGIYGTVSYIVVLRTREVGIRMAIGAQKRDILGLILRESTRPVLAGLLAGMFLAVGASYLLRGVLYGLNTVDGISFAGVSLLFLAIALLAAYPPSRRAMRVDPMVALRNE